MRKNITGKNNPNWKLKHVYHCPICNKPMIVTIKTKRRYERIERTCSRECGNAKGKLKIIGVPRPDVSKRMSENNPMKNPKNKKKTK